MRSGSALRTGLLLALSLAALALVGTGCAKKPSHLATAFVGKWVQESKPNEVMLDLRSDGQGLSKLTVYPHDQAVYWALVGNDLVITAMDGTESNRYSYRFDGPTTLVIKGKDTERRLIKQK